MPKERSEAIGIRPSVLGPWFADAEGRGPNTESGDPVPGPRRYA
jgi:hypothetical protein